MEPTSRSKTVLLGAAGLGTAVLITWLLLTRRKRNRQLQKVGEVSHLYLYPVKSCRGLTLPEAECKPFGLQSGNLKDRHWLVVQENKVHVTARQEPRLVLITASCDNDKLTLRAPETDKLEIPLKLPSSNDIFICKVHGNKVSGRDCGDKASQWITGFLKSREPYRLVQFEEKMKHRNPKNEYEKYTENDKVAYPDLSPLLLLSEASVDNLNSKLSKKVTHRNFRPNIVVAGCEAFEETPRRDLPYASVKPPNAAVNRRTDCQTQSTIRRMQPTIRQTHLNRPPISRQMPPKKANQPPNRGFMGRNPNWEPCDVETRYAMSKMYTDHSGS